MKQLQLFTLPKMQSMQTSSQQAKKSKKKILPRARKIYNNTYRAKLKGVNVKPHERTIYASIEQLERITEIKQVKNLCGLGFVIQTTI